MGNCSARANSATSELYLDHFVKYVTGLLQLVFGAIALLIVHVGRVECYGSVCAEDYCWSHRTSTDLFDVTKGEPLSATTGAGSMLPHKIFPALLVCQSVSTLLLLFLWCWSFAQDVRNVVQEVVAHVNRLTVQYKLYDEQAADDSDVQRIVSEASLINDLNNFLLYLLQVLAVKAPALYFRHFAKWIMVLVECLAWFMGMMSLIFPRSDIFWEYAFCKHGDGTSASTSTCYLPSSLFLRDLWYAALAILLATMTLVTFHLVNDLCRLHSYRRTFFHQMVPGAMDYRVETIVEAASRYVWLLSAHCWANAHLGTNPGLSKALAVKYRYHSSHSRKERWLNHPFPSLTSEHIERLRHFPMDCWVKSEGRRSDGSCWYCCARKGRTTTLQYDDVTEVAPGRPLGKIAGSWADSGTDRSRTFRPHAISFVDPKLTASSSPSSNQRSEFVPRMEEGYIHRHLYARRLEMNANTHEGLLDRREFVSGKQPCW